MIGSLLEALEQPALIFSAGGQVEFANGRARELLAQGDGLQLLASLCRHHVAQQPHPSFTLTPLGDCPGYVLALSHQRERCLASLVARARTAWGLTPRTMSFLERVAQGLSNKDIAAQLACAEVTVEKQLTQLFRRSGTRSRTELLARLHAL